MLITPLTPVENGHKLDDVKYMNDKHNPTLTPMQNEHELDYVNCIIDDINLTTNTHVKWSRT